MTLIEPSSLSTLTGHVVAYEPDIDRILITGEEIQAKLAELGERIGNDYAGRKLLLVGVLKGAFVVMADLARYIRLPLEFDFMAVSSYGAATQTSGVVRILKDLDHDLEGLDVLLVEDIVDSGLTLNYLLRTSERVSQLPWRSPPCCGRSTCSGYRSTSATRASRSRTSSWSATASTTRSGTATCRTSRRFAPKRTAEPDRPRRRGSAFPTSDFGRCYHAQRASVRIAPEPAPSPSTPQESQLSQPESPLRKIARTPTLWIVLITVGFMLVLSMLGGKPEGKTLTTSEFRAAVAQGDILNAKFLEGDQIITGDYAPGGRIAPRTWRIPAPTWRSCWPTLGCRTTPILSSRTRSSAPSSR